MNTSNGFTVCKPIVLFLLLATSLSYTCSSPDPKPLSLVTHQGIALQWADVTLYVIRKSFPNSPTYTSRCLGYIGLTMYESVVHGSILHQSLAGNLNGLQRLPLPEQAEYNWTIALNSGQSFIIKKLYPHTTVVDSIQRFEDAVYKKELATTTIDIAFRSQEYGKAIASAIYNWSVTDGGDQGYLHNFDPAYVFPSGPGYWRAPFAGQSSSPLPLHPHWGNNRTFVPDNGALPIPTIAPYSTSPTSVYYQYFFEVYQKRNSLTDEEKKISAWWADDPTQTASPPGHSYNLVTVLLSTQAEDLFVAAEAYAKVGISVADAFINCWKCKYHYHSERPFPYISTYIDSSYKPFWPEPPFPAFSSGHATQSAATAKALMSIFDNNKPFVDNTYENRNAEFESIPYVSRSFKTIWSTAEECAYSRFLGGIHTRQDNEVGTAQGSIIGDNVTKLSWRK